MTVADWSSVAPRESATIAATSSAKLFAFYRVRSGSDTRFLPGEGTCLRFASKAVDTLTMPSLPTGFLATGDKVKVLYKGVCVFLGDVDRILRHAGRGGDETDSVTCGGPWSKMARLVYRQYWRVETGCVLSSHLVLNQHMGSSPGASDGTPQNLNSELHEIAEHGAQHCGYQVPSSYSVSSQQLPFDECRDITVADAIRRELRFFPRAVTRFNYSTTPPTLNILRPSGNAAAYVSTVPKSSREYDYDAHPITGVCLEIETTGDGYRSISTQAAGNTAAGNPDCLYATLHLQGGSTSTVRQSFVSITEAIPTNLEDKSWWMSKHPRLSNLAATAVSIVQGSGTRSGASDASSYPNISEASAYDLQAAGLRSRVERFSCRATVTTADDVEEEILLTMDFLTTNATGTAENPRTYTWTVESSSTSGETIPTDLAAAILADRSGALRGEKMEVRLGDALPQIGDLCDGLILQSFEVDCGALIADLQFGAPEYLSPEDMASLLSGFRNKMRTTCSTSRASGIRADDGNAEVRMGGVPPLRSTEFSPGRKTKMTIGGSSSGSSQTRSGTGGGKIVLDATSGGGEFDFDTSDLDSGKTIGVHTLTVVGAGTNGANLTFKILADADITITPGSAPSGVYLYDLEWNSSYHALVKKYKSFADGNNANVPNGVTSPIETTPISDIIPSGS